MTISIFKLRGIIQELFTANPLYTECITLSETELVPKNTYTTSFNFLFPLSISACIYYKKVWV